MHLGYIHEPAEENPELALRHFGRALELLRIGNAAAAIEEFQQALQHNPDFAEARAKLQELTGRPDGGFQGSTSTQ
jgi:tetratricopeptide (TPR) repeat protein